MGMGSTTPGAQHCAVTEPLPVPQDLSLCASPDVIQEGPREPDPGMNLWDSWKEIQ